MAFLVGLVADLQSRNYKRRREAREAVLAGVADCWMARLGLSEAQEDRVRSLLWELSR
jgi:hypothetical protein